MNNCFQELNWLSKSQNTSPATQTILRQVRDYLNTHFKHIQYRTFKKLGLPIGSGMVESVCKWLIQQRFKGVGMHWSEDGFNHLLHLRLAWVNQRFDTLFNDYMHPIEIFFMIRDDQGHLPYFTGDYKAQNNRCFANKIIPFCNKSPCTLN
ncbi:hypothetical protein I8748_17185 [Nostoc sp. CENA67]|uniref:Uncharacterized protein n=1 Tax=Amazonocrinis nigriterrae CENA67 TaxID=2794033 RepID=A0A8J7L7Y2_9NOST|nr:hypothetical protein [Amazonocrinis nigriterrae CENA67]